MQPVFGAAAVLPGRDAGGKVSAWEKVRRSLQTQTCCGTSGTGYLA